MEYMHDPTHDRHLVPFKSNCQIKIKDAFIITMIPKLYLQYFVMDTID